MRIVLTHTGSAVPDYTDITIRQMQFSNPGIPIDFIAEEEHGEAFKKRFNLSINIIPSEGLKEDLLLRSFHQHSWFKAWGKPETVYPSPENFVQGTSERLFLLSAYINNNNLHDVWHFENDNLIYGNIGHTTIQLRLDKLRNNDRIIICNMGPQYVVFNCVYIPKPEMLLSAMAWYLKQLMLGNEALSKKFNLPMAHEMTVMKHHADAFYFWPSIPNYDVYNGTLFDPAGYGQFKGGTNNGHPPGFRDTENHDIGMQHTKFWTGVLFDGEPASPKVLDIYGNPYPLFNLHMHNKTRIKEFANV